MYHGGKVVPYIHTCSTCTNCRGVKKPSDASAGCDADLPALPSEEENIKALKKLMPVGQDFGCSVIQRHLRIGYNRSFRLMEMMVESGDAVWETETRISFR